MTITSFLSLILSLLGKYTSDEQQAQLAKYASLGLSAWMHAGATGEGFKAVAAEVQTLADGGWVAGDVIAAYDAAEAQLSFDFDSLRGI